MRERLDRGFVSTSRQAILVRVDQLLAERVCRLVDREARSFGCDLQDLPIGIAEVDALEVTARQRAGDGDAVVHQPTFPLELLGLVFYGQRNVVHTADAPGAARCGWPFEEGKQRARCSLLLAIVEMIGARQVEIDRPLDEVEPEYVAVEDQVDPGVPRDHRDVMKALRDKFAHYCSLWHTLSRAPDLACAGVVQVAPAPLRSMRHISP